MAASNKKPKTVYLKPKEQSKKKTESDEKLDVSEAEPAIAAQEPPLIKDVSKPDEDALRSELRSLRQTAVSLTVGEKEGASALIKEWLEDNPDQQDENTEESEGE